MTYWNHLFVSYRREPLWTPWAREHLRSMLTAYLQPELKAKPEIFIDEATDISPNWLEDISQNLARSRAMLAVLSGDYFQSPWCLHELDLMLERNKGQPRLILGVVVQDCRRLPPPLGQLASANFEDYRYTHLNKEGSTYERFSGAVKRLAPILAQVIRDAPDFDPLWEDACTSRFRNVYAANSSGGTVLPSHFQPPPQPSLLVVPRLIV
jgi:hypothetical protein